MIHILCPIDFSTSSINAVEYAINFCKDFHAKLSLIHVQILEKKSNKKTDSEDIRERMDDFLETIYEKHHFRIHKATSRTSSSFKFGIKKEIRENDYDLIIMGTNGEDETSQVLFGSNTYHIIRKIGLPVLFIPEKAIFCHLSHIVYATDYRNKDLGSIHKLIQLTKNENTTISVVHVNDQKCGAFTSIFELIRDSLKKEYNNPNVRYEQIIHKDVPKGLIEFVDKKNADLLVLLTREHSLFRKLFEKSVTKKISQLAYFPVLVYQEVDA